MLTCPVDHPLVSAALIGALLRPSWLRARRLSFSATGAPRDQVIFSAGGFEELMNAPLRNKARVLWSGRHTREVPKVATVKEGAF